MDMLDKFAYAAAAAGIAVSGYAFTHSATQHISVDSEAKKITLSESMAFSAGYGIGGSYNISTTFDFAAGTKTVDQKTYVIPFREDIVGPDAITQKDIADLAEYPEAAQFFRENPGVLKFSR